MTRILHIDDEECDDCGDVTKHDIRVEIREAGKSGYSREPYRVTECQECGHETAKRMGGRG